MKCHLDSVIRVLNVRAGWPVGAAPIAETASDWLEGLRFDIIGNNRSHLNGFLWGVEDNWVVGPKSMVGLKGKTQLFDDLNPLKAFLFNFLFDQCINKVFCGQTFPGLLFFPANLFTLLVFPLLFLPHRHFHFTSREIEKLNVLMKVKVFLIFAKTLPKTGFFCELRLFTVASLKKSSFPIHRSM